MAWLQSQTPFKLIQVKKKFVVAHSINFKIKATFNHIFYSYSIHFKIKDPFKLMLWNTFN